MPVQTQMQVRRGTASSWTSTNPTLAAGELGFETDTGKFKIGTGSSTWTSLSYFSTDTNFVTLTGTQTLTNKTLTAPSINLATVTQATSYTLVLTDNGDIVEMSGGGTLTVPTNASAPFPVGAQINILQTGASQVTVGGAGVTINATPGLKLRAQWSMATLIKRATDTWVLVGDLSA